MQTFSQRMWIEPQPFLQKDSISEKLKNKIWNILCEYIFGEDEYKTLSSYFLYKYAYYFWLNKDTLSDYIGWFKRELYKKLGEGRYSVYDHIEFFYSTYKNNSFIKELNQVLTEENSAYRISQDGLCLPISNEEELKTVNEATTSPYAPVNKHIQKAISLFKNDPADYANSIKESISAVEALCQIIIEDENTTLGKAIKKLKEKGVIIPPALEEAFNKLYGYTSDAWGIRHALSEGDTPPTFDDAKYMLVSCSAFVNYLISKMN